MDNFFKFNKILCSEITNESKIESESLLNDRKSLTELFSCIDNTSLNATDNSNSIESFCTNTLLLMEHSNVPHVASVCVYPSHVATAKRIMTDSDISVAAVAGGFPAGQIPVKLKTDEVKYVLDEGADEVDFVINRGAFLKGDRNYVFDEVASAKEQCKDKLLKVIIESGELGSEENIYDASLTVLEAGADFVKTSTGKIQTGATPEAAASMLLALKDFSKKNRKKSRFQSLWRYSHSFGCFNLLVSNKKNI